MKPERIDAQRLLIPLASGKDALLFANKDVVLDRSSFEDLHRFSEVSRTIDTLRSLGLLRENAELQQIALTPDFHKGALMPVGTTALTRGCVLPQAAGNDIGCGMAIAALSIDAAEIASLDGRLDRALRHAFFEGGRHIEMDAQGRETLLRDGLTGLSEAPPVGLLADHVVNAKAWALRAHQSGYLGESDGQNVLSEWIRPGDRSGPTRDSFLGTIGGGNHFVELQTIESLQDSTRAWNWGLARGRAAVMVHSGSLSLGRAVALRHVERARALWPKGLRHPANGVYALALQGPHSAGAAYLADMRAAGHIAMANRTLMILMVADVLSKIVGRRIDASLIHDSPHNLVWVNGDQALHRKGACPVVYEPADKQFSNGAPIIIPGSMGTSSHLLASLDAHVSLGSAPHGAGRALSRNAGRQRSEPCALRIVTKVDLATARSDIAEAAATALSEESDGVYKSIGPIIDTVTKAGIATEVATLKPILTIKG